MNQERPLHIPVMVSEVVDFFRQGCPRVILDGTAGGGGHSAALLDSIPDVHLILIDRDPSAVSILREKFKDNDRVDIRLGSYTSVPSVLEELGWSEVDGALFDLGFSSIQLGDSSRGFSYQKDGPLDMRYNPESNESTASDLVNNLSEKKLVDLFRNLGEERFSRRIARFIVENRPIRTTSDLRAIVKRAVRGRSNKTLSRVFQALRITVNNELNELENLLENISGWIAPGGRAAFLTFHSLEDRIVKIFFRDSENFSPCKPPWKIPDKEEILINIRSRSARMRMALRK